MVKTEDYLKILNCNQVFRENIDKFKEAFIEYYGEEYRSFVEKQFSKALYIACLSPDKIESIIRNVSDEKSSEIINSIIKKSGTNLEVKDLFGNYSLNYVNLLPIQDFKNFLELYKMGKEGRKKRYLDLGFNFISSYIRSMTKEEYIEMFNSGNILEKYHNISPILKDSLEDYIDVSKADKTYEDLFDDLKNLFAKINKDITLDNLDNYINLSEFSRVNTLIDLYDKGLTEYNNFMNNFYEYKKIVDESDKRKMRLLEDYHKELIKQNIDLLPEDRRKDVLDYACGNEENYFFNDLEKDVFGFSLNSVILIESFSSKASKELGDENVSEWCKKSIIQDRIKYFKNYGINLGDDYQKYLDSDEVKKIWPDVKRIDKYLDSRNEIINKFNIEFYEEMESHKEARREIEQFHLLDKDDSFNAKIFTQNEIAFVNPNIVKSQSGYDVFSLVVFNFSSILDNCIDHTICHELNHLLETSLSEVNGNSYKVLSGWDIMECNFDQDVKSSVNTISSKEDKRSYELFSEIINELIAQDISKIMIDNGIYVFDSKDNVKYKNTTSYEFSLFLVKDFYKEYKDDIIKSRRDGNINIILNKVGLDNFEELNSLFHIFFENFSNFKIYVLADSLNKKEDNELTRIYYDLIARRDKIMENMRNYSLSNEESVHIVHR